MKNLFTILFLSAALLIACGESAPENKAGTKASSSSTAKEPPTLSKENKRLFYETLNVRTIGYRRQLKSMQSETGAITQSPLIVSTIELMSKAEFDPEAFEAVFNSYFEQIKSGDPALKEAHINSFMLTAHSYLDKLVGNNIQGLSEEKSGALSELVEAIKNAGIEPGSITSSWNAEQLEEIEALPVVGSIEKIFNK